MTYFAKGRHFRVFATSTYRRLYKAGYREIVWCNGDFILIQKEWTR